MSDRVIDILIIVFIIFLLIMAFGLGRYFEAYVAGLDPVACKYCVCQAVRP